MGRRPNEIINPQIEYLIRQSSKQYITSPHYLLILLNELLDDSKDIQEWERSKMKGIVTKLKSAKKDLGDLLVAKPNLQLKKPADKKPENNSLLAHLQKTIKEQSFIEKEGDARDWNRKVFGAASNVCKIMKNEGISEINKEDELILSKIKNYTDIWVSENKVRS